MKSSLFLSLLAPLLTPTLPLTQAAPSPSLDALLSLTSTSPHGLIPLDSSLFDSLVTPRSHPRDYSISVLLTATNPKYGCNPCKRFGPEYEIVADSWRRQGESSKEGKRQFFAVLDFEKGQEVFRRLQITTVPLLYHYPATDGPHASPVPLPPSGFLSHDFNRNGLEADGFVRFLQSQHIPLQLRRPIDYVKYGLLSLIGGGAAVLIRVAWPYLGAFLTSRYVWALATMAAILTLTSGHMWNTIRNPPYMMPGRNGELNLIAAGYQNQFGVETHIVGSLYGVLAFTVFTLTETLPKLGKDPLRQRVGIYVWVGVWVVMMGALMSIFRIKNPAYPFKLVF